MATMREIFDLNGSDKGTKKHKYDRCYEHYMRDKKDDQLNILEIGCFKGDSIGAWVDYFPHATIYTIDIFDRVKSEEIDILKHERVKWLKGDSTHVVLPHNMRKEWGDVKFDFIIDDGAHWPEANRKTFENCMPFLAEDGTYFIEDVFMLDRPWGNTAWTQKHRQRYILGEHIRLMTMLEDSRYDLKHYDYHRQHPDSYILRVQNA